MFGAQHLLDVLHFSGRHQHHCVTAASRLRPHYELMVHSNSHMTVFSRYCQSFSSRHTMSLGVWLSQSVKERFWQASLLQGMTLHQIVLLYPHKRILKFPAAETCEKKRHNSTMSPLMVWSNPFSRGLFNGIVKVKSHPLYVFMDDPHGASVQKIIIPVHAVLIIALEFEPRPSLCLRLEIAKIQVFHSNCHVTIVSKDNG